MIKTKFKNWLLPFLITFPLAIDFSLHRLNLLNKYPYGIVFTVEIIFQAVVITVIYSTPFFIGLSFLKKAELKGYLYKINGTIPLLFCIVSILWTIFHIPSYLNLIPRPYIEDGSPSEQILFIILLHTFLTYFIFNNRIILYLIVNKTAPEMHQDFIEKYLNRMNRYRNASILLIIILICISILPQLLKSIHIKLI